MPVTSREEYELRRSRETSLRIVAVGLPLGLIAIAAAILLTL